MKNKVDILFACDSNESRPWYRDRIPGINQAIENVSFNVKLIDIYELLGEHEYTPTNVEERKAFLQHVNLTNANKTFENTILEIMPRVLVLGTADNYHQFLLPQTVRNIRLNGISIVGILGDDEFNYPQYRFLVGWFDLFVAYVKPMLEYYESFRLTKGYYFPNSCFLDNKKFSEHSQSTDYDAIVVGAPIANRPEMVDALIGSGLNVAIYGSRGWEEYASLKEYYHGFIPTEDFDRILSKGKIVLAFLEDHITGQLHMNTKVWEAIRVARLPVVTHYESLIKDYGFNEGVDIIMYKNVSDLVEKVNFYANHDDERILIAKKAYEKVKNEFDYGLMYENFFVSLEAIQRGNAINVAVDKEQIEQALLNSNLTYFGTKRSVLDCEIVNVIKIIESLDSNEFDYIYFDKLEAGKRVINKWPFVNFDSILFLGKNKSKLSCIITFFKSFIKRKSLHVNQFYISSEEKTVFGTLNRNIDIILNTKKGRSFKKIINTKLKL